MTESSCKRLLTISVLLLTTWVGTPAEAARSKKGMATFTVGHRFGSGTLSGGLTASVSADRRFHKGISLFGVIDLHEIRDNRWWRKTSSTGIGGWVGLNLRVRPRDPGFKLIPGLALGVLALPSGGFGQFGTVRFSLDLAYVPKAEVGLMAQFSVIKALSDIDTRYDFKLRFDPLISFRVGLIVRSF